MAKDVVVLDRGNAGIIGSIFPELPTKPNGDCYLVDMCPSTDGLTSRRELHQESGDTVPWEKLREMQCTEWRCWCLIQKWRRLSWGVHRLKFKRWCWHLQGENLNMIKSRIKPWAKPTKFEREMRELDNITFPYARQHMDRQSIRAVSSTDPQRSIVTRHRILRPI